MDSYIELSSFVDELKEYEELLEKPDSEPSDKIKRAFVPYGLYVRFPFLRQYFIPKNKEEIREKIRGRLLGKAGKLSTRITELVGTDEITIHEFGQPRSISVWAMGLRKEFDYRTSEALSACVDYTLQAIGKLKSDIEEGIRDEKGKIIEKPTATAVTVEALEGRVQREEKQDLGKEIRKQLSGTPEELAPHIVRVANEFQFPQGFNCYAEEDSYKSSQFSKQFTIYRITDSFTPGVIWGGAKPEELPRAIGTITLQPLPNNRALLIAKHTLPSFDSGGSYFDSFLEGLSLEFKNLSIEETTVQKTWRWFNRIVELWAKLKP